MKKSHLRLVCVNSDQTGITAHPDDLPIRELATEERRKIEAVWQPSKITFQRAYVCAVLDLEWWKAKSFERQQEISAAICIVEEARHQEHLLELVLSTPFAKPSVPAFRSWRLKHEQSEIVRASRINPHDLNRCEDEGSVMVALGDARLWWRVREEVYFAVARSIRIVDPSIDRCTSDEQVAPIVEYVLRQLCYDIWINVEELMSMEFPPLPRLP